MNKQNPPYNNCTEDFNCYILIMKAGFMRQSSAAGLGALAISFLRAIM